MRRCFDAMNEDSLPEMQRDFQLDPPEEKATPAPVDLTRIRAAHTHNETANHRNVGLVIETRPDEITPEELVWLRQLGVTKVQMGAQSLDDRVLNLNLRGHTSRRHPESHHPAACRRIQDRAALDAQFLGATIESDRLILPACGRMVTPRMNSRSTPPSCWNPPNFTILATRRVQAIYNWLNLSR